MERVLEFSSIAGPRPFHAALVELGGAVGSSGPPHAHDFWEAFYVLEGAGRHTAGNWEEPLLPGRLTLIRPDDSHTIQAAEGSQLRFVNVAFPAEDWREFCSLAGLEGPLQRWEAAGMPVSVAPPAGQRRQCDESFHGALRSFSTDADRLALLRFWSILAGLLPDGGESPRARWDGAPPWLERCLLEMQHLHNLQGGLPRLRELSGVSHAHLSRAFRRHLGKSPTEFLNELRLERASLLLLTTGDQIIDIAHDVGFDNLSYFYRQFRLRFGRPPGSMRTGASS